MRRTTAVLPLPVQELLKAIAKVLFVQAAGDGQERACVIWGGDSTPVWAGCEGDSLLNADYTIQTVPGNPSGIEYYQAILDTDGL